MKRRPSLITQHPCTDHYDIFSKALFLSRTQKIIQFNELTWVTSLETALGECWWRSWGCHGIRFLKGRERQQKGDKNLITKLICLIHSSAYDQSWIRLRRVVFMCVWAQHVYMHKVKWQWMRKRSILNDLQNQKHGEERTLGIQILFRPRWSFQSLRCTITQRAVGMSRCLSVCSVRQQEDWMWWI